MYILWLLKRPYIQWGVKCVLASLFLYLALYVIWLCLPAPKLDRPFESSTLLLDDSDSMLRIMIAEDQRYRLYTSIDAIAPSLITATILYEDNDFYRHIGVDFKAIIRAAWESFVVRERRVGASTITMQLARQYWKIPSHTVKGKVLQIYRALQLERHLDKNKILELYFNLVSYGGNIEGIGAASHIYFNKAPLALSELESLSLAVIPQNPNKRNPSTAYGLKALYPARNALIKKFVKTGSHKQYLIKYQNLPLNVRASKNLPFNAPHFVEYINKKYSYAEIKTTINTKIQKIVESRVAHYLNTHKEKGFENAVVTVLNYKTMELKALVGSANYYNFNIDGQVNGATAKRSPGSTLKPFLYALAFNEGLIHPLSLMKDTQQRYAGFSPENFDQTYWGPVSAKKALIASRNVPAVYLQSELIKIKKQPFFYNFLKKAGITNMRDAQYYGLALSLGGMEVSMLELVSLYAMLANKGEIKPIRVVNNQIQVIPERLLSTSASFLTLDILKDNRAPIARYTNDRARLNQNDVAWKTGTSWAFRDAWAIGISKEYVIAVWLGDFKGAGHSSLVGRTAAGPLLFDLFDTLNTQTGWRISSLFNLEQMNIKSLDVCAKTGDIDTQYCPQTVETYFIPGVSPIRSSDIYRPVNIDKKTGLRACRAGINGTVKKVYEFWPSDFYQNFIEAGVRINSPPAYMPQCDLNKVVSYSKDPVISSPQPTLDYVLTAGSALQVLPLLAITDTSVTQLSWFINEVFVGHSHPNKPLFWPMKAGEKTIKVVDDVGRVATVKIHIVRK